MIALALAAALACSVTDGDTLRCGDERIRIMGMDTAETRARCEREAIMAHLATERLRELLADGFTIHRDGTDRYGRTLAVVTVGGVDVAEIMVSEGLARPYAGGKREGWCR